MTTDNSKGIEKLTNGVFYSSKPFESRSCSLEGKIHYRFMNHFMIDKETQLLSECQVFKICEKRDEAPHIIGEANKKVKEKIKQFILDTGLRKVLEIGSGSSPLSFPSESKISLTISDANPKIVRQHRRENRDCIHLGNNCNDFTENQIQFDIIVAIFVLHFKIDSNEIKTIRKHLSEHGIFIANIYRLTEEAKLELEEKFKLENLYIEKKQDTLKICKNNEYWICGKNKTTVENISKLIGDTS